MLSAESFFRSIAELPDSEIDLARSALEIGRIEFPDLQASHYLRMLDTLAARTPRASTPLAQIDRLNHQLFELERFRGNAAHYYDPRNCYLHEVLERRLGLPITLSVVYIEVARRKGLNIEGVGMPGHFLVRLRDSSGDLLIDPFEQGKLLTLEECQMRLQQIYGAGAQLETYMLQPTEKKQILARILNNLRNIRVTQRQFKKLLPVLDVQLALFPHDPHVLKQRAWLYAQLNNYRAALADLDHYLSLYHQAEDADEVMLQIQQLTVISRGSA